MGAARDDDAGVLRQKQRYLQRMDNFVRNIRKKIVEVEVTGRPEEGEPEAPATTHPQAYARKFNKQAYAWSRLFNGIISFQSKCLICVCLQVAFIYLLIKR